MRIRPIALFAAGALFSAGVIGTTTWIRAADNNVISTCANKKTGVMRYLLKGSCNKRTEIEISWNEMGVVGPQGPKGDVGAKGDAGAVGQKGDAGSAGTDGIDGQNLVVADANGKTLGELLSATGSFTAITFRDAEGGIWSPAFLQSNYYENPSVVLYEDTACTKAIIGYTAATGTEAPTGLRVVERTRPALYTTLTETNRAFRLTGSASPESDFPNLYYFKQTSTYPTTPRTWTCSDYRLIAGWEANFIQTRFFRTEETAFARYQAPLRIVSP